MANNNNLVSLSLDLDTSKADSKLEKWKQQAQQPINIPVDIDDSSIKEKLKNIMASADIEIKLNGTSLNQQISQMSSTIKNGLTSAPIDIPFQFDISDSQKVKAEVEKLVAKVTNNQGQLSKWKIGFGVDGEANRVLLTYKNELGEVTDAAIRLRQVGTVIDNKGNEVALMQWASGLRAVSQNVDAVIKANQKEAESVANVIRKRQELIEQMKVVNAQSDKAGITLNQENQQKFNTLSANASTVEDVRQLEHYLRLARVELQELNASISKGTHATSLESMNTNLADIPNKLALIEAKFNAIQMPESVRLQIEQLKQDIEAVNNEEDPTKKITQYNTLVQSLKDLERQYQITNQEQKNINNELSAIQGGKVLSNNIVTWMSENRAAAVKYADELEKIVAASQNVSNTKELQKLSEQFRVIKTEAEATEKASTGFFGMLKQSFGAAFENMLKYRLAYEIINKTTQAIREMISTVSELDRTLVEMNKVADLSTAQMEEFLDKAYKISTEVGRSGRSMIEASTEFVRAGYSVEESLELGRAALITTNVGDAIDSTADAAGTLIAVLKGFKMSDTDVIKIVDKMNQVSNNAPISFDKLADGLERISGVMNTYGNSLDETIGLITAGYGALRNVEKVSTGLGTISARLRGVDEDGNAIDGLSAELEDAFGRVGVAITDPEGELRSTYDILRDYAAVYDEIDTKTRQWLNELAAGKRQLTVLDAVVSNWNDVENAISQATDSEGSAVRENEIYRQSIEGLRNEFENAKEQLSTEIIESDWVKDIISGATELLYAFKNIMNQEGLISGIIGNVAEGFESFASALERLTSNGVIAKLLQLLLTYKTITVGAGLLNKAKQFIGVFDAVGSHIGSWISGLNTTKNAIIDIGDEAVGSSKKVSGLSDKLSKLGKGLTVGNLFSAIGAVLAIGYALESNREKKIKEDSEEVIKTFEDTKSKLEANKTVYKELSEQYIELSKGVDALGHNVALTDDQYQQYKTTVSQLVEINPSLLQGYNDQGTAILTIRDSVDALTDSYKENIIAANNAIIKDKDKIGKNYAENINPNTPGYVVNEYDKFTSQKAIDELLTLPDINADTVRELLDKYSYDTTNNIADILEENDYSTGLTETYFDMIARALKDDEGRLALQVASAEYKASVAEYNKGMTDFANAFTENQLMQSEIDDNLKQLIQNDINNLDTEFFSQFVNDDYTYNFNALEGQLLEIINTYNKLQDNHPEIIEMGINLKTKFNSGDITADEYINKVEEINGVLSKYPEDVQKNVKMIFGIDEDDSVLEQINHLKALLGDNYTDDAIEGLTAEELNYIAQIEVKADPYSLEQLKEIVSSALSPQEIEVKPKVSSVDAVDSMADAKSTINSLESLYDQVVNNNESNGQAVGFADPALINSVESAFKGIADEDAEVSLALSQFEDILVRFPNDADKAQNAIDGLITAYIDQTDIIQNLTEENAEWSEAQLTAMGITNAHEVVQSRLKKQVKETQKAIAELADKIYAYNEALEEGGDGAEEFAGITELVSKALTLYDENGDAVMTPIIDDSFVKQHMDDIQAMAAGDVEALNRVRRAAAEEAVLKVTTNVDDQYALASIQNLMDECMKLDDMDIEVGASVNDADFIAGLNNMISSGKYTADQVSAALESMGYTATWTPNRYTASVATAIIQRGGTGNTAADEAMKRGITRLQEEKAVLDIPSLTITRKGKAGGGSVARYGGGGGSSSGGRSGGSGGGGGGSSSEPNKPKEESEETFDWIIVAIQRIEEEIARLDKVVGNSYDLWGHRNSALLKELEKTKELINAQKLAQQEYQRYLKSIQINNGKGLNPDDYGENDQLVKAQDQRLLDEAKKAWATGEYQRKVLMGQLSGSDIEKIANHFLVDAINEAKEYQQKVIDAKDAIQELTIKLGDLAKTNFDNLQKEFEDTIDYLKSFSDITDERINRAEKSGYFVSSNYYKQLIDYEKKSIDSSKKEYEGLIQKRNEAVSAGYISANSEEFARMNKEILGVAKAIEEATTNIVEYNREIRQIRWDVFDFLRERIDKVNTEFEFLIDLLDNQTLYDDWGTFNNRGWADTLLHASRYNVYMQQSLDYAKERSNIEKELANDRADKELIERREELIKLQQESIQNAYQEKEAVRDLVEQGINIHLKSLNDLIEKYKESLKNARDLFNYQRNINKQVENISSLQKQLQAYSGDDSEESRATIQKLRKNLDDAQEQLKETEWDKYISETETFLSDMYDDYNDLLQKRLDDVDILMHDMIDASNKHHAEISDIIKQVSGEVGYNLSKSTDTLLNSSNDALVSDFKNRFATYATNTEDAINDIKNYVSSIKDKTVSNAVSTANVDKTPRVKYNPVYNGVDYSGVFDLNYYMNKYTDLQKVFGNDYDKYLEHFVNYGMKEGRQGSEVFDLNYYKNKYADLRKAFGNDNQKYYAHFLNHGMNEGRQASELFNAYIYKNLYEDLQKAFQNDMKKYYIHYNNFGVAEGRRGYSKGTNDSRNELAWTQEEHKQELIYRSSDGAILTPLTSGSMVFTHDMTKNLWNLSKKNIASHTEIPNTTAPFKQVNNENHITIELPNVVDYASFKQQIQKDPQISKLIQQITLGEATNGIKLNKYKY